MDINDLDFNEYKKRLEQKEKAILRKGTYAELSLDKSYIIVWCDGETFRIPYSQALYKWIKTYIDKANAQL